MFTNIFKSAKTQVLEEANKIYFKAWKNNETITVVKESFYTDTFRLSFGRLQVHINSVAFSRLVSFSRYEKMITTNNSEILKYWAVALAASNQGRKISDFLDLVKVVDLTR